MKIIIPFILFFCLCAAAQDMPMPPEHHHGGQAPAQHKMEQDQPVDLVIAHSHGSSGTAWQPLSTPPHMWMKQSGGWLLMAHGNLFLSYNQQGGPRGVGKFESTNWAMFMEQHPLGRGTIQVRQMLSAEPLTAPHCGFPQIFQTGETYKGLPLVDHQHPHDVFGELSILYSLPLNKTLSWMLYGAPAGEPAFGPVAYVHRWSASELGAAPLGHHLQDSTHISYGVVTTGLVLKTSEHSGLRLEGSAFNGREPDENRATLDFGALDSFSGRLSFDFLRSWTAQYSYVHLVHPEALEPTNINRQTASVMYNLPLATIAGNLATTVLWGRNRKLTEQTTQNSYLLESVLNFKARNYAYTRMELVDKDELFPPALFPPQPGISDRSFRVGAYTFGAVRDLTQTSLFQMGLGADFTVYTKPALLDAFYGKNPVSARIFLRFRPAKNQHAHSM